MECWHAYMWVSWWLNGKADATMQEIKEIQVQSLGQEDPREGHGNAFQYSCQENPIAEKPGRLQSEGHKESWTQLK